MRHSVNPADLDLTDNNCRLFKLSETQQERKNQAIRAHASQVDTWMPDCEPVLPQHVIALFEDQCEPFFVKDIT